MSEKYFVHKDALVESDTIGMGMRVWRNAHIMPGAVIGENCNIGENCYIEGHVVIGNGVTVKNNVAIWGKIAIEDNVFIVPAAVLPTIHARGRLLKTSSRSGINRNQKRGDHWG